MKFALWAPPTLGIKSNVECNCAAAASAAALQRCNTLPEDFDSCCDSNRLLLNTLLRIGSEKRDGGVGGAIGLGEVAQELRGEGHVCDRRFQ